MKYAVIRIKGQQYKVSEGDVFDIDFLGNELKWKGISTNKTNSFNDIDLNRLEIIKSQLLKICNILYLIYPFLYFTKHLLTYHNYIFHMLFVGFLVQSCLLCLLE